VRRIEVFARNAPRASSPLIQKNETATSMTADIDDNSASVMMIIIINGLSLQLMKMK
jgi:hypothetical protein